MKINQAWRVKAAILIVISFFSARLCFSQSIEYDNPDGSVSNLYSKSYALIIGNDDYSDWPDLPGVSKDVVAIKEELERHGFETEIHKNLSREEFRSAILGFIARKGLKFENRLLIYYAGHGYTLKKSYGDNLGYIVPVDSPIPTDALPGFLEKAINMHEFETFAKEIDAKHAMFVFDACFSGTIFSTTRGPSPSITAKITQPTRFFISSGSEDQEVPDESIFRRYFVNGLQGDADMNADGFVTGIELGEFLYEKVVNESYNAQTPQYGTLRNPSLSRGDLVFKVGKGKLTFRSFSADNPPIIIAPKSVFAFDGEKPCFEVQIVGENNNLRVMGDLIDASGSLLSSTCSFAPKTQNNDEIAYFTQVDNYLPPGEYKIIIKAAEKALISRETVDLTVFPANLYDPQKTDASLRYGLRTGEYLNLDPEPASRGAIPYSEFITEVSLIKTDTVETYRLVGVKVGRDQGIILDDDVASLNVKLSRRNPTCKTETTLFENEYRVKVPTPEIVLENLEGGSVFTEENKINFKLRRIGIAYPYGFEVEAFCDARIRDLKNDSELFLIEKIKLQNETVTTPDIVFLSDIHPEVKRIIEEGVYDGKSIEEIKYEVLQYGFDLPEFDIVGEKKVKSKNMFFAEIPLTPENLSSDVDFQTAVELLRNSTSDFEIELVFNARAINGVSGAESQTVRRAKKIPARSYLFFD